MSPYCSLPPPAPAPRDSSVTSGHWQFRSEATAAIGDTHYLAAGDGNQMSVVEAWASTPVGLQDPPRRADGSVDANRLRQYEWHCGFLNRVRETMGRVRDAGFKTAPSAECGRSPATDAQIRRGTA